MERSLEGRGVIGRSSDNVLQEMNAGRICPEQFDIGQKAEAGPSANKQWAYVAVR